MRDMNVNRLDANVVAALRSCVLEMINKAQEPGSPPNAEVIFDAVCGFYSGQVPIETDDEGVGFIVFCRGSRRNRDWLSVHRAVLQTAARGARHESEKFHAQGRRMGISRHAVESSGEYHARARSF